VFVGECQLFNASLVGEKKKEVEDEVEVSRNINKLCIFGNKTKRLTFACGMAAWSSQYGL
jgi:hypothetical protein